MIEKVFNVVIGEDMLAGIKPPRHPSAHAVRFGFLCRQVEKYPAERRLVTGRRKTARMMAPIGSRLLLEILPCFFVVALERMRIQMWGMKVVVDVLRRQESLLFFGKNCLESKRDL